MERTRTSALALVLLVVSCTGCVERLLRVRTDPDGARVFVDGEEVGKTELDHPFSFYGTVSVVVRRSGYLSKRLTVDLDPPWYQYFPLDFVAEFFVPWTIEDVHRVDAQLEKLPEKVDQSVRDDLDRRAAAAGRNR